MYAIITEAGNKKQFVKDFTKRQLDKKYVVELTLDEEEAKRFEKDETKTFIDNIHNPYFREFSTQKVTGKQKKQVTISEDLS